MERRDRRVVHPDILKYSVLRGSEEERIRGVDIGQQPFAPNQRFGQMVASDLY